MTAHQHHEVLHACEEVAAHISDEAANPIRKVLTEALLRAVYRGLTQWVAEAIQQDDNTPGFDNDNVVVGHSAMPEAPAANGVGRAAIQLGDELRGDDFDRYLRYRGSAKPVFPLATD